MAAGLVFAAQSPRRVTLTAGGLRVAVAVEQVCCPDGRKRTVSLKSGFMTGTLYGEDRWKLDADDLRELRAEAKSR
jgi:hypothetical protein